MLLEEKLGIVIYQNQTFWMSFADSKYFFVTDNLNRYEIRYLDGSRGRGELGDLRS